MGDFTNEQAIYLEKTRELLKKFEPIEDMIKNLELLPQGKHNQLAWYYLGKAKLQIMLAVSAGCPDFDKKELSNE